METDASRKRDALYWAERAERGIYWAVGALLIVVAVIFLVFIIVKDFPLYFKGEFATATIKLFDQALLTLMLAQVVYTTVSFLKVGSLQVEPILVVGIIASVRRILVLTAVVAGTAGNVGATLTFRQDMVEIGLLSLTVLILAVAIYLVRKSKQFLAPASCPLLPATPDQPFAARAACQDSQALLGPDRLRRPDRDGV